MATAPSSIENHLPQEPAKPPRLLMLPAYAALFAACGMAAYVLAYHLDVTAFSIAYSVAFLLAIGATFIANHGKEGWRFGAQLVRFITVPVLLVIAMFGNSELFFTRSWLSDANSVVAGYIGLIMVGCILLIGLRVEGKTVPVAMPLVATMSLFGLLNLVLVDTIVQVGFLVFAAAGMFLVGYERVLMNWHKRRGNGRHSSAQNDESHSEAHMRLTARQFIGASAVWFAVFVVGALIAYTPLYTLLPGIMPTAALSRLSEASQKPFDWSSAPEQLEVRGGNHTLTERPVLKARIMQGVSSGLWRGRAYRNYVASSWKDDGDTDDEGQENFAKAYISGGRLTALPQIPTGAPRPIPKEQDGIREPDYNAMLAALNKGLVPKYGSAHLTTAEMKPIDTGTRVLYSAGLPVAMRALWSQIDININTGTPNTALPITQYPEAKYTVTGRSVEMTNSSTQARGLTADELKQWHDTIRLAPYLKVTDNAQNTRQLKNIARQILDKARSEGKNVDTPVSKAMAVGAYLHGTCLYALNSPITPSSEDGVLYFLQTTKSGACDMFASSMTLLLRSMDVPARLVTGYLEPDASEQDGEGILIRERDAHAWVEYYSPELGWVTHDPSAGTRLAEDSWMSRFKKSVADLFADKSGALLLFPIAGLLLLAVGLFWPQIEKRLGRAPTIGNADEAQRERIERAYTQAAQQVQRYAKTRAKTTAPRRALTSKELDDWLSRTELPAAARQEFAALTYLRSAARYGILPLEANEADIRASLQRLKAALK